MATDQSVDLAMDPTVVNGTQETGLGQEPQLPSTSTALDVVCGPLLNYRYMSDTTSDTPVWHGSILIVTAPGPRDPELTLRCIGAVGDSTSTDGEADQSEQFRGERLYEDPKKAFFRFKINVLIQAYEARWEYTIPGMTLQNGNTNPHMVFAVPSRQQSMRIMFHSCNGFSVGTDMPTFSGPNGVLWKDVLRMHQDQPFHVMIGGGDQIYQDGVRVEGPLNMWSNMANPHKRREYPFGEQMRLECDEYYYNNYIDWYGKDPFRHANAQIPQINIWDDHDIIDGFGSYTDHFMRCSVFRGIGGVAHKYYMLFQHHIAPPKSTFTTDSAKTMHGEKPSDPVQLENTFVLEETGSDPCYIIGQKPGPYVEQRSRNIYCQLGARVAFAGIDARTERTRHQINYPETYKQFFDYVSNELSKNKDIKHLIMLLGVPIAYPRLQWLENIISSPIIGPIRFLNRRFGFAGGLFNKFDGQVDLLDDLDDHYTARHHKGERRDLIHILQNLAKQHNVRITMLSGDVHLAAIGRFYSNPGLSIPAERDWRYMPNIISSAITNKPPPPAVANLLARRNKVHRLDRETDETMLELFDHDPGQGPKANGDGPDSNEGKCLPFRSGKANNCTMPSRNYAIIAESHAPGAAAPPPNPTAAGAAAPTADGEIEATGVPRQNTTNGGQIKNPRRPIHAGEASAGMSHPAASGLDKTGLCGPYGLDITLRVEIDSKNAEGITDGYGFSIPALDATEVPLETKVG
ncbi:hypothetical protein P152DRAFT_421002 [Eremomyces bilateralis CBS 781.70]|uniref:PhoD-like phosphatase domain-containing protein n=1 Tax=Eremomyces bilateralis CBS 781.70 TaxID=1392243 RepID=A0A6G1FX50_9PEZI|nr:uncharacterized protein P152DRAFT_421002 [Eremomyces bilateralis CBS 781.70]KAF1810417.1 hypothetical protein P152DRAFT_421002 [Eremomyces bilateralis CBS 781.70]